MSLEENIDKLLTEERRKKDISVPERVVDIEKDYLRRLQETDYLLTVQDLKQFMHKTLICKDFYGQKEASMRANVEKWKSLKEQIFAREKNKIDKGSDAERGRKVLANNEVYQKADQLYHHYNRSYRFFEARNKSMEHKLNNCKALLKKDEI